MRIILIEDDQNKLEQLGKFFKSRFSIDLSLDDARSYQSGMSKLLNEKYDLIILDMSMPNYDRSTSDSGGRPRNFAGKDILFQMDENEITTPVVVVTQFESFGEGVNTISLQELGDCLSIEYPKTYKGLVYYNSAQSAWMTTLESLVQKVGII